MIVLLLALAGLPLQGVAATLSNLLCSDNSGAPVMHMDYGIAHGSHGDESRPAVQNDDDASTNFAGQLCIHVTAAASPNTVPMLAPPDSPVRTVFPDLLRDLHRPDQPQRPPLA